MIGLSWCFVDTDSQTFERFGIGVRGCASLRLALSVLLSVMSYAFSLSSLVLAPWLAIGVFFAASAWGDQAEGKGSASPPEEAAESKTNAATAAQGDVRIIVASAKKEFRRFSVDVNVLSFSFGRYGVNLGWMPQKHHALTLNPHYDAVGAKVTLSELTRDHEQVLWDCIRGFGSEFGYRYYSGTKGPEGFFIGPSVLIAGYATDPADKVLSKSRTFGSYGLALDLGGQAVVAPGVVVGGGFGLQYTRVTNRSDGWWEAIPRYATRLLSEGVHPRFLFAFGYAF